MNRFNFSRVIFTAWVLSISFLSWAEPIGQSAAGGATAKATDKLNPEIAVKAELDKTSVTIGDKIRYSLIVSAKNDLEVEFPDFGADLGNFTIRDFGSNKKVFLGRQKITQWYIVDIYVTGKQAIPKALIKYRRPGESEWSRLESKEKEIEVKSLLDKPGMKPELRPIKKPRGFLFNSRSAFMGVVIILFILTGMGIFWVKKKNSMLSVEAVPAHQIALERLNELKAKDLIAQGKIKEYYIEISGIIRHYIENRFMLSAPEMTSEEFLLKAKEAQELSLSEKDLLREFLLSCDLVKFARYAPTFDEIGVVFESAQRFVEQTSKEINVPA